MGELAAALAGREPPPGLSAEELLSRNWWSGPEIFLIVDDIQQLPAGFDSPLHKAAPWVTRAADVGLRHRHPHLRWVVFGRQRPDAAGAGPGQRAAAGDGRRPRRGFIRGKMKGGPLPRGRGLLMAEDTGVFVQVAATEFRK